MWTSNLKGLISYFSFGVPCTKTSEDFDNRSRDLLGSFDSSLMFLLDNGVCSYSDIYAPQSVNFMCPSILSH